MYLVTISYITFLTYLHFLISIRFKIYSVTDGVIEESESADFAKIQKQLGQIFMAIDSLQLWLNKRPKFTQYIDYHSSLC